MSRVSAENFRPSIVVSGSGVPFSEDKYKDLVVLGGSGARLLLSVVKPCSRCQMPNVNPATGHFYGEESGRGAAPLPSAVLKSFRTGRALGLADPAWQGDVSTHPARPPAA